MSAATHFRSQAQACARLGSPMYAELVARLADDLDDDGYTATIIEPWGEASGPDAVALRLTGAIHRLVLLGDAPELAAYYPSAGGRWSLDAAWPLVQRVMREHHASITESMQSPPQTNEVGRSAALMGGLLALQAEVALPVRVFEIGASAGLNLLFDKFRYLDSRAEAYGAAQSQVVIENAWTHAELSARTVEVIERRGCDVAPVPITTEAERARLLSYIWPDQERRFERVTGALEIARRTPPDVQPGRAIDFVRELEPADGALTVLWHSIMWQYVDPLEQQQILQAVASLSARSSVHAPVVHLRLEPRRRRPGSAHEILLSQDLCRGGSRSSIVAHSSPHGPPIEWE